MGNVIDGIGGKGAEYGAPELVTGGSDGVDESPDDPASSCGQESS